MLDALGHDVPEATIAHGLAPDYAAFLAGKAPKARPAGIEPGPMPTWMHPLQAHGAGFAIRQGRAGIYYDTGLGKTGVQLEAMRQLAAASNGFALILTPLAVARQIEVEGLRFGYDVRVIRDQSEAAPGINICNYDRVDKLDPAAFGAVSLDESSVLKNFTGALRTRLTEAFRDTPFKLCATATPAPNDHMELGQQAEFLGVMPSNEMLMRWFTADQTEMGRYRLKRHGETAFWDWMASWSRCAQSPEDLGFDGAAFVLPLLNVHRHRVEGGGDTRKPIGGLFAADVSATTMFRVKRETCQARAAAAADLVRGKSDVPWLLWCDTNDEAKALLAALVGESVVEVQGAQSAEQKEAGIAAFGDGRARIMVTKPSICGAGVNWQHCADVVFVGRTFSYEAYYQAVRRCWRFGQRRPVNVHLIVAEGEEQIGRVVERKAADHAAMKLAMAAAMRRARSVDASKKAYWPRHLAPLPAWLECAA